MLFVVWLATQNHSTLVTETTVVPFLPVNPEYSSTRNQACQLYRNLPFKHFVVCHCTFAVMLFFLFQGRQKLARFNAHEFATLVIDILSDAKRRQQGNSIASPKGWHLIVTSFQDLTDPEVSHRFVVTFLLLCYQTMLNLSWKVWAADIVAIARIMTSLTTTVWHLMRIPIKTSPRAKEIGPRYRGDTNLEEQSLSLSWCHCPFNPSLPQSLDSDLSDGPITVQEYMEVKNALSTSEAKIQHLMKANSNLSDELRLMQRKVSTALHQ